MVLVAVLASEVVLLFDFNFSISTDVLEPFTFLVCGLSTEKPGLILCT